MCWFLLKKLDKIFYQHLIFIIQYTVSWVNLKRHFSGPDQSLNLQTIQIRTDSKPQHGENICSEFFCNYRCQIYMSNLESNYRGWVGLDEEKGYQQTHRQMNWFRALMTILQ